ncbi:MAG: DNA polymerase III subunit [Clostridia bacterium]|nr:DNA polymerase III subunit [Clostridia bacterium]
MFENILGHDNVKKQLKSDFEESKVSHAYLFLGIEGIGKKTLAIEFAKKLLNTDNLETCVDYKYIEKLPDKKEIIVEQVRNKIVNDVYVAPATGNYKVYIVNDAHLLNTAAQNALLKTLEEPPNYVVIILISNNEKALLTTVLSRVKKVNFNSLSNSDVEALLASKYNLEISNSKLEYAGGSLKVAIELANMEDNKYLKLDELHSCYKKRDVIAAIKCVEQVSFKDEETFNYLQYLFMQDRDYSKIQFIEKARNRMRRNANEDMVKQALNIQLMKGGR